MIIKKNMIRSRSIFKKCMLVFLILILFGGGFCFLYQYTKYNIKKEVKYISLDPKNDYKIQWDDRVLEDKIRNIICKKNGDIYLSDIWRCEALDLRREIDEDGKITGETIKSISNLKGLKNLKSLFLDFNQVTDISAISTMDNLKYLSLNGNPIQDISAIKSLSHLFYLNLSNTSMHDEDLKNLSDLKNLRGLILNYNKIKSLENLGNLNLYAISLTGNQIIEIKPLLNLNKKTLVYLDLEKNQIHDIEILSKFKNLESLLLGNNNVSFIKPIIKLKKISDLYFANNQITALPNLSGMESLIYLDLSNNKISTQEWEKVKLPWKVKKVTISGNPIKDLKTIKKYPEVNFVFN